VGGTAVRVLRYPPHWSAVAPPSAAAAAPAPAAASADAADGSDAGTRYSDTGTPRDGGGYSDTGTAQDTGTPRAAGGGGGGSRPLWFHAVVTGLRPESQSVDLEYAPVP